MIIITPIIGIIIIITTLMNIIILLLLTGEWQQ
jgi:hypothetical protein